ncbi:MAG: dihydrofolate reductase family protein [Bacteroidota bacterium]
MILYIAVSLDGFIAGKSGELDWLFTEGDYGYETFFESLGATVMGHETYRVIRDFGEPFPYAGKRNLVFSRQERPTYEHVEFVQGDVADHITSLQKTIQGNIWIVGGGQIVRSCMEAGIIDEYRLFLHPIVLGEGVPLFLTQPHRRSLKVVETRTYSNGMVELHYRKASTDEDLKPPASD